MVNVIPVTLVFATGRVEAGLDSPFSFMFWMGSTRAQGGRAGVAGTQLAERCCLCKGAAACLKGKTIVTLEVAKHFSRTAACGESFPSGGELSCQEMTWW